MHAGGLRSRGVVAVLLADCGGVEALRALDPVRRVLVAVPAELAVRLELAVSEAGPGGAVLIHDPCRTPVGAEVFTRLFAELREHECDAVVAAAPATDTLKRADAEGRIVATVDRGAMWEIRTPQLYRADALSRHDVEVLGAAMLSGDDSRLPRLLDGRVRVVPLPPEVSERHPTRSSASTRERSAG